MLRVLSDERRLLFRERRPHRCDDFRDAGEHQSNRIEISFDDDEPLRFADRLFRPIQSVEKLALGEDLGVGGVEIFGLALAENAAAKSNRMTGRIMDRKDRAIPKTRPWLGTILANDEQTRGDLTCVVEAERGQRGAHRGNVARRIADTESIGILARQPARREIFARELAGRRLPELRSEEFGNRRVHLPKRLARILLVAAPGGDFPNLHTDFRPDPLHRLGEIEAELLLHEREHVARLTADEAFVTAGRGDRKVGILPMVKRARSAKTVANALELHELADDGDNVRFLSDAVDDLVGNHANSANVTPAPPSFHAPRRNALTRVSLRSISPTRSRNAPVPFP